MKHEFLHGALSYEVEEALRHWIMEHTRTQQPATYPLHQQCLFY
jgi:hypothetical protein